MAQDIGAAVSRRDQRKQERREAIVEAACQSFLEHGYAGTSMSGLLEVLGGSKGTIWAHFRSKGQLFAAAVEHLTAAFHVDLQGLLTSADGPDLVLNEFCRRFLRRIAAPDAVATWRMVVAESGRSPELGQIFFSRTTGVTEKALSLYLGRNIILGKLKPDDPVKMAQMLVSLCLSWHNRVLLGVQAADTASADEYASRAADLFLNGYRTDSSH